MRVTTATLKKTCAARIGPEAALVAVGQHGQEGGRDDDRRQHERHEHERAGERAAAKPEPADRPREREPGGEREHRRRAACQIVNQSELGRARRQREARRGRQAALEDRGEWKREEEREERRRDGDRGELRGRGSAQDDLCPLVDPAIAVAADLGRGQLERVRRRDGVLAERLRQRRAVAHRAARTCSPASTPGTAPRA